MREFAKDFYNSPAWKHCRVAYAQSQMGLCERCLERGIYKPGEIVHHKIWLTPDNIGDESITLSWDNLQLLCREHHAEEHNKKPVRYKLDDLGRVIITE